VENRSLFSSCKQFVDVLNVFGGVTSRDTRDVAEHGLVKGNSISSPQFRRFRFGQKKWRPFMELRRGDMAHTPDWLEWVRPIRLEQLYAYGAGRDILQCHGGIGASSKALSNEPVSKPGNRLH